MKNVIYTYRYFWKTTDTESPLKVKYLCEGDEGHTTFIESLKNNPSVLSCYREYVGEVNVAFIGFTENIKLEKKEGEEK